MTLYFGIVQEEAVNVAGKGRRRRPKDGSDEVVVKEWRSHSELRLLQREHPVLIPRSLLEGSKGNRMTINDSCVCLGGLPNIREKLGTEQPGDHLVALEGADTTQDFAAMV